MVKVVVPKMRKKKKKTLVKRIFVQFHFFHDYFYLSTKIFQLKFTNFMIDG